MNENVKKYGVITAIVAWFILVILVAIFMVSCGKPKSMVEPGDVVKKIVVDSFVVLPPHSTIETDNTYKYYTSDSSEFTSRTKYRIGDTITIIYKKLK